MTPLSYSRRPSLDYDFHREAAARMRSELVHKGISRGISAVAPSGRTLRTLGVAVLVATGAFWTVMLVKPPQTVAADPATVTSSLSPLTFSVSSDLASTAYDAH